MIRSRLKRNDMPDWVYRRLKAGDAVRVTYTNKTTRWFINGREIRQNDYDQPLTWPETLVKYAVIAAVLIAFRAVLGWLGVPL